MWKFVTNIFICFVFIFSFVSCSRIDTQTGRQSRGEAERLTIKKLGIQYSKTYDYKHDSGKIDKNSAFLTELVEYDKEGSVVREETYYNDEFMKRFESVKLYSYDSNKNQVEIVKKDFDGNIESVIKNVFKGNINTERYIFNPDGTLNRKVLYKYDDRGNQVELTVYDNHGNVISKNVTIYNTKNEPMEFREYDANGRLTELTNIVDIGNYEEEWIVLNEKEEQIYITRVKMNKNGKILQHSRIENDGTVRGRFENKYDKNNLLTESRSYYQTSTEPIKITRTEYIKFNK